MQCVEDRLVILVNQHHHPLPGLSMQGTDQVSETPRGRSLQRLHCGVTLNLSELGLHVLVEIVCARSVEPGEVEPDQRIADGPIPAVVGVQSLEQFPPACKQLLQRVEE